MLGRVEFLPRSFISKTITSAYYKFVVIHQRYADIRQYALVQTRLDQFIQKLFKFCLCNLGLFG